MGKKQLKNNGIEKQKIASEIIDQIERIKDKIKIVTIIDNLKGYLGNVVSDTPWYCWKWAWVEFNEFEKKGEISQENIQKELSDIEASIDKWENIQKKLSNIEASIDKWENVIKYETTKNLEFIEFINKNLKNKPYDEFENNLKNYIENTKSNFFEYFKYMEAQKLILNKTLGLFGLKPDDGKILEITTRVQKCLSIEEDITNINNEIENSETNNQRRSSRTCTIL